MRYLTVPLMKKHCNVDACFHDDDEYFGMLGDVAEQMVETHLGDSLENIVKENSKLPAPIKHAMLLLVANMYMNRESVSYGSAQDIPHSYDYLLNQFENFKTYQG